MWKINYSLTGFYVFKWCRIFYRFEIGHHIYFGFNHSGKTLPLVIPYIPRSRSNDVKSNILEIIQSRPWNSNQNCYEFYMQTYTNFPSYPRCINLIVI